MTFDREVDGELSTESVSTGDLDIDGNDFVSKGDFIGLRSFGPTNADGFSTTNQSYTSGDFADVFFADYDIALPDGGEPAILTEIDVVDQQSIRLRNLNNSTDVFERTGSSDNVSRIDPYTPTNKSGVTLAIQIKSPGGSSVEIREFSVIQGIQL